LRLVGAAAEAAREKLAAIVEISKQATNAGVSTNFLQQWNAQAKELGLTAQQTAAMLQHARDAGEVKIGEGGEANTSEIVSRLEEHLKAGNIKKLDLSEIINAKDAEDRIRIILNLVDRLISEGKTLAALDIMGRNFGKDAENQMRNGVNLTQKMRDAMKETKDVAFPPDIIQRGVELNKQLDDADKKLREGWAPIMNDITRFQQTMLGNFADIKTAVAEIGVLIGGWYKSIQAATQGIIDMANRSTFAKGLADWTRSLPPEVRNFGLPESMHVHDIDDKERNEMVQRKILLDRINAPIPAFDFGKDTSKGLPKKGTATKESNDEIETYINNLNKTVDVLKAENETFNLSNTAKAKAVDMEKLLAAARSAGREPTEKEIENVRRLAGEEGKAKDAHERLTQAFAAANERANFFGEQAISAIEKIGVSGTRAKDVILDFAKALEKAALQALLLGSGPLAQLFGTQGAGGAAGGLFGGLLGGKGLFSGLGGSSYGASDYATAAAAAAPGMYGPGFAGGGMVGRDGMPTFIPYAALAAAKRFDGGGGVAAIVHPGEVILNAAQQRNVASKMGGGGPINLTHAPTISGLGMTQEQAFAFVTRSQKEFARNILPILNNAQRRYG
jgi:hypothetical protein